MRQAGLIILSLILSQAIQAFPAFTVTDEGDPSVVAVTEAPVITISTFPTELTVEGLISLSKSNFLLQLGAFGRKANADALCEKLEAMLMIDVEVVSDNGLYKVIINNSSEKGAVCYFIPVNFPETRNIRKTKSNSEAPDETPVMEADDTLQTETIARDTIPEIAETADATLTMVAEQNNAVVVPEKKGISLGKLLILPGDSPWLNRLDYFGKSVALVNALIFTIISCVVVMIILLFVILLNRRRMEKEARLRQYLLEKYQGLIVDYLFGDTKADEFRPIASDIYRREVLIDQMIDVSVNLKGEAGDKLNRLYRELNLDTDSVRRARSRRWHIKIKGFRELAFMNIKDGNNDIYKSLNSKNEILRMEAQIAMVRLSDDDPFAFLSHLRRPFSLWEQITLHDLIIQHELPVPDFQKWLTSANPTVAMFALRMIREFKQSYAEPEVRKALLHRDPQVSLLAVQVAGDLGMRSALETMKRMYKYQDYNNCLEIVKSMGKMPDLSMMGFLKLVLDKEDDVQLQIEATKAIENMGEEGVSTLVKIMKSEYKNYNIIVRHVLDRRIY